MFKKLRQLYFRLHEVELELSVWETETQAYGVDEYDYISTIKTRKEELIKEITNLLSDEKYKES